MTVIVAGDERARSIVRPETAAASDLFLSSVKVVAGTGFEPVTFRL